MSTPGNENPNTQETTFEEQVSEAVTILSKGEELAEDVSPELKYAATAEVRRKKTQASFTKNQQELAATKAEKTELIGLAKKNLNVSLTDEQKEELEDLKFSDPDAWRRKMNSYETEAQTKLDVVIDEKLQAASAKGGEQAELEQNKQVLADFVTANPDFVLNDDILANDVPPRITRKYDKREITFGAFLQEVHTYLAKGKRVADVKTDDEPNLSKVGGGDTPDEASMTKHGEESYKTVTF